MDEEYFDAEDEDALVKSTHDIFVDADASLVKTPDFNIKPDDWRVHILKQIKVNKSQGYNKFGRCLYLKSPIKTEEPRITVFVNVGDEIRMYGPSHLSFELVKRGETPDKDMSYTFGFGPERIEEEGANPFVASGVLGTAVSGTVFPLTSLDFTGAVTSLGTGFYTANSLLSHRGCFFSPDPYLETQIKYFLTDEDQKNYTKILQGTCKIGNDLLSTKLASAINRIFAYVNNAKIKVIEGKFSDGSPNVNILVPQKWSVINSSCRFRNAENCASFFQTMLGSDLIECALYKMVATDPSTCKFNKELECDDCAMRDFQYISRDNFGGRKTKKWRITRLREKKRTKNRKPYRKDQYKVKYLYPLLLK